MIQSPIQSPIQSEQVDSYKMAVNILIDTHGPLCCRRRDCMLLLDVLGGRRQGNVDVMYLALFQSRFALDHRSSLGRFRGAFTHEECLRLFGEWWLGMGEEMAAEGDEYIRVSISQAHTDVHRLHYTSAWRNCMKKGPAGCRSHFGDADEVEEAAGEYLNACRNADANNGSTALFTLSTPSLAKIARPPPLTRQKNFISAHWRGFVIIWMGRTSKALILAKKRVCGHFGTIGDFGYIRNGEGGER
jgi:hypothetical protein